MCSSCGESSACEAIRHCVKASSLLTWWGPPLFTRSRLGVLYMTQPSVPPTKTRVMKATPGSSGAGGGAGAGAEQLNVKRLEA